MWAHLPENPHKIVMLRSVHDVQLLRTAVAIRCIRPLRRNMGRRTLGKETQLTICNIMPPKVVVVVGAVEVAAPRPATSTTIRSHVRERDIPK